MGAETISTCSPKFKISILLPHLVYELEQFESSMVFQFFGFETHIMGPINPKICTKAVFPHLSSEFQKSTSSCFEILQFTPLVAEKPLILHGKKQRDLRCEASRKCKKKILIGLKMLTSGSFQNVAEDYINDAQSACSLYDV